MLKSKIEICPHCGQKMRVYPRAIRSNMVYMMQKLFMKFKNNPMKTNEIDDRTRIASDFTKLQYWGLIEEAEENKWKLTSRGITFLFGQFQIKKYKWIYNQTVQEDPIGEENPFIYVRDIKPSKICKELILEESMNYSDFFRSKLNAEKYYEAQLPLFPDGERN